MGKIVPNRNPLWSLGLTTFYPHSDYDKGVVTCFLLVFPCKARQRFLFTYM
jgi:hypothetical protein